MFIDTDKEGERYSGVASLIAFEAHRPRPKTNPLSGSWPELSAAGKQASIIQ